MSRIGQQPVELPQGVTAAVADRQVTVKGPNGELALELPPMVRAAVEDGKVVVAQDSSDRKAGSFQGLARSLIANMVEGVSKGFTRDLEIEGVGFRAALQGQVLELSLGFASPVKFDVPDGITVQVDGNTKLQVRGADKQQVGDVAARIRSFFPVEPYKGKGIRYKDERVRRKVGKTVA